jgi:hypothetical protein
MDIETAKALKPGTRVRITKTRPGWFFNVGDEATLTKLDTRDDDGDWLAKFDSGINYYVELGFGVDYEVIDSNDVTSW